MPKQIPEADKPQFLYDLGYIIDQLRGAYHLALEDRPDPYEHNSFVEAWLAQARNLTEFFMGTKTYAGAVKGFVDGGYQVFSGPDADRLWEEISNQLSHPALRLSKHGDKIRPNSDDMALLEGEIALFQKHLMSKYKSMLNLRSTPTVELGPVRANATSELTGPGSSIKT